MNSSQQPPQTILVVDDEAQVRELLAESMGYMGHTVVTAVDGLDALEKTDQQSFDIVLTDMDMPRMDGMELIKHLREKKNGIDIIAITGHTVRYKYTDVIAAGAADFITKPFTLDELEAKLKRLIRERCQRLELEDLAIRDPLTSLFNRRYFQEIAQKEVVRSVRYEHPLALLFIDLDRFKQYNDENGHRAGDKVLVGLAQVLKACTREHVDSVFRFGGDEFTVLMPYMTAMQAMTVANRIQESYRKLNFTPTTLSIGIAQYTAKSGDIDRDIDDMIQRADSALYTVKHELGRGKVFIERSSREVEQAS